MPPTPSAKASTRSCSRVKPPSAPGRPARSRRSRRSCVEAERMPSEHVPPAVDPTGSVHGRALCEAAVTLATTGRADAIVAVTREGKTARLLASLRPAIRVIATTDSAAVAGTLALYRGIHPVITPALRARDARTDAARASARERGRRGRLHQREPRHDPGRCQLPQRAEDRMSSPSHPATRRLVGLRHRQLPAARRRHPDGPGLGQRRSSSRTSTSRTGRCTSSSTTSGWCSSSRWPRRRSSRRRCPAAPWPRPARPRCRCSPPLGGMIAPAGIYALLVMHDGAARADAAAGRSRAPPTSRSRI